MIKEARKLAVYNKRFNHIWFLGGEMVEVIERLPASRNVRVAHISSLTGETSDISFTVDVDDITPIEDINEELRTNDYIVLHYSDGMQGVVCFDHTPAPVIRLYTNVPEEDIIRAEEDATFADFEFLIGHEEQVFEGHDISALAQMWLSWHKRSVLNVPTNFT